MPNPNAYARGLPEPYATLRARVAAFIPAERLVTDPLRLLTWGTPSRKRPP